jgi:hypothetical protein
MNKVIDNTKKKSKDNFKNGAVESITELTNGNLVKAILSLISTTSREIKLQRARNLIFELNRDNVIAERGLIHILNDQEHEMHELIISSVTKVIDEFNPIKRQIISRVILYAIKNNTLDDFHESLYNNLHLFTNNDFNAIVKIKNGISSKEIPRDEQHGHYKILNEDYKNSDIIQASLKLISLNIFQDIEGSVFGSEDIRTQVSVLLFYIPSNENLEILFNYIANNN